MGLTLLSQNDVRQIALSNLGVHDTTLDSPEALAAVLRRAAGLRCPCLPRELVDAAATALDGLSEIEDLREVVRTSLEGLIAYGDLQEHEAEDTPGMPKRRLLYATPPSFVVRPERMYLVGIAPEQPSVVPDAIETRVQRQGNVRYLEAAGDEAVGTLRAFGLLEIRHDDWLWAPSVEDATRHRERFDRRLGDADPVAAVPDLQILDPDRPVPFYKGRWTEPKARHTGRYVGRRSQLYGSDLWSYVELNGGRPVRLVDFPFGEEEGPLGRAAADQALRLQAAIDHDAGHPQALRVRPGTGGTVRFDLFAPPPGWLRRRWSVLGEQVERGRSALLTFALPQSEAQEEQRLARERMWLTIEESP